MKRSDKWYRDGLKFGCQKCGNCCTVNGDYAYVYITDREARAIMEHMEIPRKEFMRSYCSRLEGRMIIRFKNSTCAFLKDNLCTIYKVRPFQCKAWPFWTENLDEWVWYEEVGDICPGLNRGKQYSPAEVEKLAEQVNKRLDLEVDEVDSHIV